MIDLYASIQRHFDAAVKNKKCPTCGQVPTVEYFKDGVSLKCQCGSCPEEEYKETLIQAFSDAVNDEMRKIANR